MKKRLIVLGALGAAAGIAVAKNKKNAGKNEEKKEVSKKKED